MIMIREVTAEHTICDADIKALFQVADGMPDTIFKLIDRIFSCWGDIANITHQLEKIIEMVKDLETLDVLFVDYDDIRAGDYIDLLSTADTVPGTDWYQHRLLQDFLLDLQFVTSAISLVEDCQELLAQLKEETK